MTLFVHTANALYLGSYLVKNMLWLRVLTVIAALTLLPYFYFQPQVLWPPIFWNLLFTTINVVKLVRLVRRRYARDRTDLQPEHLDAIGFSVFAAGDVGDLHVAAHDHLDSGDFEAGYQALKPHLRAARPVDPVDPVEASRWTHVHWHQLVFELETGRFDDAYDRFKRTVLVSAIRDDSAATDAPSAMWLLALTARTPVALPWETVADISRSRRGVSTSLVSFHDLLAFAGARSELSMQRWIDGTASGSEELSPLVPFAACLRDVMVHGRSEDCDRLSVLAGNLRLPGASAGQNRLLQTFADNAHKLTFATASLRAA